MEDSFIECSDLKHATEFPDVILNSQITDCHLSAFKTINHSQLKGIHEDAEFTARYIERNDLEQSVEME